MNLWAHSFILNRLALVILIGTTTNQLRQSILTVSV